MTEAAPWNLERTRDFVLRRFGERQVELLSPCLDSLSDRQFFCWYHHDRFTTRLKEEIDDKLGDRHVMELLLPLSQDGWQAHHFMALQLAADVTACVASLHSLLDTLGHAVALSLGLNLAQEPISGRQISFARVAKRLSAGRQFQSVGDAMREIEVNPDFAYLEALSNHSKHRSIIGPQLCVDARRDDNSYSVEFSAFQYDNVRYERREVRSFLNPMHSAISNGIVRCGHQINEHLRLLDIVDVGKATSNMNEASS